MIRKCEERPREMKLALPAETGTRQGAGESVEARELEVLLEQTVLRWEGTARTRGRNEARTNDWVGDTYTCPKTPRRIAFGEARQRSADAVVRPSIVESSTRTPLAVWTKGFNTSGPCLIC